MTALFNKQHHMAGAEYAIRNILKVTRRETPDVKGQGIQVGLTVFH